MKIAQINTTCGAGSTGKICVAVSDLLSQASVENHILYTAGHSNHPAGIKYMSVFEAKLQALKSRVFGNYGFQSKQATKRLVAELERIAPDIVHLHNLHGHNVHLGILFSYLKEKHLKIFWTFHDCWAFTGYCPHYDMAGCSKWQTGCQNCPQRSHYSWFFDRSAMLYEKKKQLFFPPYRSMCLRYPILEHWAILLPLFWLIRLFDLAIHHRDRYRRAMNRLDKMSDEKIIRYQQELNYVGLDYNFGGDDPPTKEER